MTYVDLIVKRKPWARLYRHQDVFYWHGWYCTHGHLMRNIPKPIPYGTWAWRTGPFVINGAKLLYRRKHWGVDWRWNNQVRL